MICEFCTVKVSPFTCKVVLEDVPGIDIICPPITTLDGRTCTGMLSIVVEAGTLPALELIGVKGLLMMEAMMFPIWVVVGDWPAAGDVLLVLTKGVDLLLLAWVLGKGEPP